MLQKLWIEVVKVDKYFSWFCLDVHTLKSLHFYFIANFDAFSFSSPFMHEFDPLPFTIMFWQCNTHELLTKFASKL